MTLFTAGIGLPCFDVPSDLWPFDLYILYKPLIPLCISLKWRHVSLALQMCRLWSSPCVSASACKCVVFISWRRACCESCTYELCRGRNSILVQTCRLFIILTGEISPMQCPDLQHEGTACKIFTCSQEVNKRPLLASWDQSKVWAKNMKGWDSIWRVGAGGGVSLYVSHAYRSRCESRCASLLCVKKAEVRRATYGSRQIPGATDLSCCGMKKTWQFNVELLPCKHETWKHALVECLIHSLGLKRNVHAHISLLFVFILYSFFWFIWL